MAWNYTDTEYIKLYRKFIGWEWYQDVNTKVLFLHCLLRANWKPGRWQGMEYKAGQFITSLSQLSKETGLTVMQVRTALKHLKLTGEVTDFQQANFRIITVKNWVRYQADNKPINKPLTDDQQAVNNRYKKIISIKDKNVYKEPTQTEIEEYCLQKNYQINDIDKFISYNSGKGWSMDWKVALDLWYKKGKESKPKQNSFNMMIQHDDYDMDELERKLLWIVNKEEQ